MIRNRHLLAGLVLVPLALWAAAVLPGIATDNGGFWQWRRAVVLFSGVLVLWWMSAGILLATRPAWLERALGGLDRLYRLHRDIGIGAGVLVFMHWMAEWAPKNLSKLGLLPPRGRGPRGEPSLWIDLAKDVGEWTGYIVMALVVVSLLRRVPYRAFRLIHKVFALLFVAGTFHGLVLLPRDWWSGPLAWSTALLAAAGVAAALLSLSGRIGVRRRHAARIEALVARSDGVLEVTLRPAAGWPGHRAGQFVLVDFGHRFEGAHPFTVASAWSAAQGTVILAIKALGDYTRSLPRLLQVGQTATLEGPYGGFDFAAREADGRQVWVAGGIGVTPFLARLRELREKGRRADGVALFYSVRNDAVDAFGGELADLCRATGVQLQRWESDAQGPLPAALIGRQAGRGSSVWFCGPSAWGESLRLWLRNAGLPGGAFHREYFEFR